VLYLYSPSHHPSSSSIIILLSIFYVYLSSYISQQQLTPSHFFVFAATSSLAACSLSSMSNSTKVEEEGVEVNLALAVPPNPTGKKNSSEVNINALPPFTITSEDGVNKIRRRFALAALVIAAGGAGVSIGTMTNKDIIAKAVDANTNFSKASKAPSKKQVCLADPFNDTYDNPCMCGVDEAMVADSRIMETSLKYRVYADSQEDVESAVTSIEESIQKSIIKSGTCGPLSKDADQVIITEVSSSHVIITDEPCPGDNADGIDAKVCKVVSGGFTVKVGVTASHGGQEERMLQLDKPAKKELEAQLDGAIIQLQDELGLTKKEANAIEKKLNKVLKAAIKSLSGGAAGSVEISIVGDSIEIKVVPPCSWKLNEGYCRNPNSCFPITTCPTSAAVGDTIGELDFNGSTYSIILDSITSDTEIYTIPFGTIILLDDGNSLFFLGLTWTIAP
jgi:hypothetical protein